MSERVTGSAVEAFLNCLGSAVLPREPESVSRDADRGTAIHRFLEDVRNGVPRDVALERVPVAWSYTCACIDCDALPLGEAEVAYAWDVQASKARKLGRGISRDYERFNLKPTEIPLTLDLEHLEVVARADRTDVLPTIIDYKSGFRAVTKAEDNPQLLLGALCVRAVTRSSMVRVQIAYVNHDGAIHYDTAEHDEMALDAFATRLRRRWSERMGAIAAYSATGQVQTQRGAWCNYCRAKGACPEFNAARQQLATLPTNWLERTRAELAEPGGQQRVWQFLETADAVVEQVRAELRASIEARGPFRMDDGRLVSIEAQTRREIDGAVARQVLTRECGEATAQEVTRYDVTLDRLKRATGARFDDVMRMIDGAGGIKRTVTKRMEARKVKGT